MESVDLNDMSNNSQIYLDAMEQLKNEYTRLESKKRIFKKLMLEQYKKNIHYSSLITTLVDMLENIVDFPEEILGIIHYLDDRAKDNIEHLLDDYLSLKLQENGNTDI